MKTASNLFEYLIMDADVGLDCSVVRDGEGDGTFEVVLEVDEVHDLGALLHGPKRSFRITIEPLESE